MKKLILSILLLIPAAIGFSQSWSLANCLWDSSSVAAGATQEYCVTTSYTGPPQASGSIIINFTAPSGTASGWDLASARVSLTDLTGTWTPTLVFGGTVQYTYNGPITDGQFAILCVSATHDGTSATMGSGATNVVPGASTCNSSIPLLLPVELTAFEAEAEGDNSVLRWTTASEDNNSHFEVQRSTDGQNFEQIGEVATLAEGGNSESELNYSYIDAGASSAGEEVYYRLMQVDIGDASFDYSRIRVVNFEAAALESLIFPNPVRKGGEVLVQVQDVQQIDLYDMKGSLVKVVEETNGQNISSIQTGDLAAGTYVMVVNGTQRMKLVVY